MAGKDDTGRRRAGRGAIMVRPKVLSWIIDSAGWRDGELALATGIDAGLIGQWRARESEIDMDDIDNMAGKVGRPLSAFMIAEPPREAPVASFRPGADSPAGLPSKQLCTAVRRAHEIQYNVRAARVCRRRARVACGRPAAAAAAAATAGTAASSGLHGRSRAGRRTRGGPHGAARRPSRRPRPRRA